MDPDTVYYHWPRPPKRRRTSSESSELHPLIRDAQFYYESGDCVIRVEDTLFRVHRFIFVRDSQVFAELFTLPQASDLAVEGKSDDLPIHLHGDKPDDFRSLFKYIYAPALETQANNIPIAEVQAVATVGLLAHKYQMTKWLEWAFLVIDQFLDGTDLSSSDLVAIYELSQKALAKGLRGDVVLHWLNRFLIGTGSLSISEALDTAEAHSDRSFLVSLYTIQLSRMPTKPTNTNQPTNLLMDGIAPIHVQRVLAGFYSLTLCWNQRRRDVIALPRRPTCPQKHHETICRLGQLSDWELAVNAAEEHSIMKERIRFLRRTLSGSLKAVDTVDRCRYTPLSVEPLVAWWDECRQNMEGHFFASEPTEGA
ncbi:hypothetical protein C8R43DRAFT_935268 [Mycena crocata]|nr:hypothetical protein C8R43DRAFT_935268 [Mycena crocata]